MNFLLTILLIAAAPSGAAISIEHMLLDAGGPLAQRYNNSIQVPIPDFTEITKVRTAQNSLSVPILSRTSETLELKAPSGHYHKTLQLQGYDSLGEGEWVDLASVTVQDPTPQFLKNLLQLQPLQPSKQWPTPFLALNIPLALSSPAPLVVFIVLNSSAEIVYAHLGRDPNGLASQQQAQVLVDGSIWSHCRWSLSPVMGAPKREGFVQHLDRSGKVLSHAPYKAGRTSKSKPGIAAAGQQVSAKEMLISWNKNLAVIGIDGSPILSLQTTQNHRLLTGQWLNYF